VDRDGALRVDDLPRLHALLAVHRDHDAEYLRAAEVQEREVNIRVAVRDLL
jgi:hypothetical protein